MEIRRKIRRYRYKLILFCFINIIYGQAEYQILTTANNAFSLSMQNGFGALPHEENNKHYNINYIQFPSQINLLSLSYKHIDFTLLDYGILEDKIDHLINNKFHAFEGYINYNFNKRILNLFNLKSSIGCLYSKIDTYNSLSLVSNIYLKTNVEKSNMNIGLLLKNLGRIINEYTPYQQQLPLQIQLSLIKKINQNIALGYDINYNNSIKHITHIICYSMKINESISLQTSTTNNRKDLLISNDPYTALYGFSFGLSIKNNKKINYDFGISNLGSGGFIYAFSMSF